MKNWRTDLVAYAGFAFILLALALVYFDKATLDQVSHFAGMVAVGLITMGFKLSKDSKTKE